LAGDPDHTSAFQAALTVGERHDPRALATLADIAHRDSADPWFRIAHPEFRGGRRVAFFHLLLAKGETWTAPELLVETSAMIGGRANPAELAAWFRAVPGLTHPDLYMAGLARGLRLVDARNLKVAGAEQAFARWLASGSEARAAKRLGDVAPLRAHRADRAGPPGCRETRASGGVARACRARPSRGRFEAVAPVLEEVLRSHPPAEVETPRWTLWLRLTNRPRDDHS